MRDLVIDIGNSSAKWALFENERMIDDGRSDESIGSLVEVLHERFSPDRMAMASVRELSEITQEHLLVDVNTPIPIRIEYQTKESLGIDRILAAVGAFRRFPGIPLMVVDMGTCITLDLVGSDGTFYGGAISPGLQMRFKAMNVWTDKLPLLELDLDKTGLPGKSTVASMQNGVYYGILDEIEGTLSRYREKFDDVLLILTGGDAKLFESRLKNDIFADDLLVLKGLHEILLFNEDRF
jgi:type III pantothenate kinase